MSKQLDSMSSLLVQLNEALDEREGPGRYAKVESYKHRHEVAGDILTAIQRGLDNQNKPQGPMNFQNKPIELDSRAMTLVPGASPTPKFLESLLPLIEAGQSISLTGLNRSIVGYLNSNPGSSEHIRAELVQMLWDKNWKLASSATQATGLDEVDVAEAISDDVQINSIQEREDGIVNPFSSTFDWIWNEKPEKGWDGKEMWSSFPKWLRNDSEPIYWITGKPGSGKSTIMRLILEDLYGDKLGGSMLRSSKQFGRLVVVKYYAWKMGETVQKSIEGFKRTVISQVLKAHPDMARYATPRRWMLFQVLRSTPKFPKWESWEIEESFKALLDQCGKSIKLALFVDGLDEFDANPMEVVDLIRAISRQCKTGVKICIASRPWNEFNDAYSEQPMLQLHRVTQNDMAKFVQERLPESRGFIEQKHLYPEPTNQLVVDIVGKAEGVFLWVSLVINILLEKFNDGHTVFDVQQVLSALPPGLSELYDTMWDDIPHSKQARASKIMQVVKANDGPLPLFTVWMIEEPETGPSDFVACRSGYMYDTYDPSRMGQIRNSLNRKLRAYTRGLLEITGDESDEGKGEYAVSFLHRTGGDWAKQPEVWQRICSMIDGNWDPCQLLFEAEVRMFCTWHKEKQQTLWLRRHNRGTRLGSHVAQALYYASRVADLPPNHEPLVSWMNRLHETILPTLPNAERETFPYQFLTDAAAYGILPYIRAQYRSCPGLFRQEPPRRFPMSVLEAAILGPRADCPMPSAAKMYALDCDYDDFFQSVPKSQRLAVAEFLISHGTKVTKVYTIQFSGVSTRSLREAIIDKREVYPDYCDRALELIKKRNSGWMFPVKAVTFRMRSALSKES